MHWFEFVSSFGTLGRVQDADDDDGEDSGIAASMTKPLTRDQIWAKVAARYSTLASRR